MNIKVTDIKQYIYCPRIIYYTYVCPVPKKTTYKMETGKIEHVSLDKLEKRRTLKRYNFQEGERVFHAYLKSDRLCLEGKLDMHIVSGKQYFPVEYKFTERKAALNHKYQLISYAMLLEDHYNTAIRYGLLYLVPKRDITEVEITSNARDFIRGTIDKIKNMIGSEKFPPQQRQYAKCRDCEYLPFCNDIDGIGKRGAGSVFFN